MFEAKKAQSEFRKEHRDGEKDNQETPKEKCISKETSDKYIKN